MNDWRKPCEHGVYVGEHSTENWVWGATYWERGKYVLDEASVCPGGSPVSVADLEANEELVKRIAEILQRSGCFEPSEAVRAVLDALVHVDAK